MAEGGFEMDVFTQDAPDVDMTEETPFMDIPADESTIIHNREDALGSYTGDVLARARQELLKSKVDAFLKVVADRDGLLPAPHIYNEFTLDRDGRTLRLKDGRRVTWENDSTKYLSLKGVGTAGFIRTHLFPDYIARGSRGSVSSLRNALAAVSSATARTEELAEPQRAADVDTAVKQLFTDTRSEVATNTEGPQMRELLGLDMALQRQRGALIDNLAKLGQLDADIAQAEWELGGEEAAADPQKKRRIEDLLKHLCDERTTRLEAAAANREALRTQFSRIRETIERMLNEDTTLAERIRTLFREQGVTIASILTALGFIVSTIILAIQNAVGITGGTLQPPNGGAADWVKKQLKTLANWLKNLAEKAAEALPGVIGAVVSWLLKTAGSVAVWLAEHLWALVIALVAAAAVFLRDYRAT